SSFVSLGNILGHTPKATLDSWLDQGQADYPLARTEDWDAAERFARRPSFGKTKVPENDTTRPPNDNWAAQASHSEMETVSLIRIPLWEKAKWTGMAYSWDPTNQSPPVIALAFTDGPTGEEIFAHWQKEIGKVDTHERVRLSIIRGINRKNVHAYRVSV